MKFDLLTHAFQAAQHVPEIKDALRFHFNLLGADTAIKPALHKALLKLTWRG